MPGESDKSGGWRKWLRSFFKHRTELPCGCIITDAASPRFSDSVTELERESVEVGVKRYKQATVYDNEWKVRYECNQCKARWGDRENAGRKIDYGEENPDADLRLEVEHRPGFHGGRYVHKEVPVVEE